MSRYFLNISIFKYIVNVGTAARTYIVSQKKAQSRLFSFAMGALATASLAPFYITTCLLISITSMSVLTQKSDYSAAFWQGWWFGFGYFSTGLYWISFALGIDLITFGWLIPFAVFGLPACLAFFIACSFGLASYLSYDRVSHLLLLAISWSFFEWIRSFIFTGFPWNLLSYCWLDFVTMSQSLAIMGPFSLSLLSIVWMGIPALGVKPKLQLLILSTWVCLYGYGYLRVPTGPMPTIPNLTLRLVQPSIPHALSSSHTQQEKNFRDVIELTFSKHEGSQPNVFIWPESATPYLLANDHAKRFKIATHLSSDQIFIAGTTRGIKESPSKLTLWNSMIAFDNFGTIISFYDKSHLVPFGEYIPFRKYMPGVLKKVTAGAIDFTEGSGPRTIVHPRLPPFSPLICYEVIFPGQILSQNEPSPHWLLNITNDAWYGNTTGPHQHFDITRARAIEEGLPMVRVGNNGISGVIDPYGRVLKTLKLNERGVLDVQLPHASNDRPLYAIYRDTPMWILIIGIMIFLRIRRVFKIS